MSDKDKPEVKFECWFSYKDGGDDDYSEALAAGMVSVFSSYDAEIAASEFAKLDDEVHAYTEFGTRRIVFVRNMVSGEITKWGVTPEPAVDYCTSQIETVFIVQLSQSSPCWLTSGDGSSSRTCVKANAQQYKRRSSAQRSLNASRKHRAWKNAIILEIEK